MEIIKSELQMSGEEEINVAVANELNVPDPENADEILLNLLKKSKDISVKDLL